MQEWSNFDNGVQDTWERADWCLESGPTSWSNGFENLEVSAAAAAAATPLKGQNDSGGGSGRGLAAAAKASLMEAETASAAFSSYHAPVPVERSQDVATLAPGEPIGAGAFFSGTVVGQPNHGAQTLVECDEALAVFGTRIIKISSDRFPAWVQSGSIICFVLCRGEAVAEPDLLFGSIRRPSEVPENGPFVGTLRTFSQRSGTDVVAWLSSLATGQRFTSEVYAHSSTIEGFGAGDVIRFEVHVNAKQQPQASIGTVQRLGVSVVSNGVPTPAPSGSPYRHVKGGGKGKMSFESMDTTSFAPGRVVPMVIEDDDDDDFDAVEGDGSEHEAEVDAAFSAVEQDLAQELKRLHAGTSVNDDDDVDYVI